MMWLMYRPAASAAVATSRDHQKPKEQEKGHFTERELALLAELLQAHSKVAHKSSHSVSATEIEERAA